MELKRKKALPEVKHKQNTNSGVFTQCGAFFTMIRACNHWEDRWDIDNIIDDWFLKTFGEHPPSGTRRDIAIVIGYELVNQGYIRNKIEPSQKHKINYEASKLLLIDKTQALKNFDTKLFFYEEEMNDKLNQPFTLSKGVTWQHEKKLQRKQPLGRKPVQQKSKLLSRRQQLNQQPKRKLLQKRK